MQSEVIGDRKRAAQLLAFDGLEWGKIRPTDLDISLDFKQRLFVFGELKQSHASLTVGQRIHLEGLVKGLKAGNRDAVAFLAKHDTPDTEHDVHVAQATVVSFFDGVQWKPPKKARTNVKEFIDGCREEYNV
jgi:hypothetical protein